MILLKYNYKRIFASVLTLAIISCSNPWDERENNGDSNLENNLTEAITNTTETTEFAQLLVETGYDTILATSKSYTVFAPNNAAMADVDNTILSNPELLKQFVANHVALTTFSSIRSSDETQIKMFTNKYLIFKGKAMIDDATIVSSDHYAANGVFHIISKALTPKLNIWQYVASQAGNFETSDYLLSLKEFNIYQSDSIGKAVSQTNGVGYVADSLTNSYLKNVYNLNNEKNSYTLFLMQDDGYNEEVNKMKPYLIKKSNTTLDSTAIYAKYFTLRDMAFIKKYERNVLPDTLVSRFGVKVPVDKTQIVDEIHLSNGIVYVMKKVVVPLEKRLLTTHIEGENNDSYFNFPRARLFYRDKKDLSGLLFQDIMVQDPGAALPIIGYSAKDFYSTSYKVYWKAINDRQTNTFQQRITLAGKLEIINEKTFPADIIKQLPYTDVPPNFYGEVFVGEFTLTEARDIDLIWLIGADIATNGNNSLTLDYLKLVPQVKKP
ncbi:MAG: fasciclin domain-containing protein [Flavobacterium sp.]